ncbi:MAG: hypothetical protein ABW292_01245 [Vicinamibacterales bacterium]
MTAIIDSGEAPPPRADEAPDFSLVLGGPLYQLLRRSHLTDDALTLVHRRVVAFVLITWVPLLLLTTLEGRAWRGSVDVPFLLNFEVHARFLLALPLLVVAELVVHMRMRRALTQFIARDLIRPADLPRFHSHIESAMRLRNSLAAELVLVVLVYGLGIIVQNSVAVDANTWAAAGSASGFTNLSLAGWWHTLISVPIFQFMLVRWYFRMFIWNRFLWQVSRLELQLVPTHPDRAGGLGFLTNIVYAFAPLLLAHGALLAGLIADRIFFAGAKLSEFTLEIVAVVGVAVFVVLCPLVVFAGQLARARRVGLSEYGVLAQRYVREFDTKWVRGVRDPAEPFVGSADVQSLADLANSFDVIRTMRSVPFSKETIFQLGVVTLSPLLPLTLTMISFEELLTRLLSAVF